MKEHNVWSFDWLPDYQQIVACQEEEMTADTVGDIRQEPDSQDRDNSSRKDEKAGMLPPELLAREEQIYWKDYEYITQLLPLAARESWAAADAVLDRYEYEDSAIYTEYPDKMTMQRIADTVYEAMRFYEERPDIQKNDGSNTVNPYHCSDKETGNNSPLRDIIFTMTAWNISYRRQRYHRRRKVFPMG